MPAATPVTAPPTPVIAEGPPGRIALAGPVEADDALKAFIATYVAALNARDSNRVGDLVHGDSLACVTDPRQLVAGPAVAEEYQARARTVAADEPLPFTGLFRYPVRPTHRLRITAPDGGGSERILLLHSRQDRWRVVLPCPKARAGARSGPSGG